MSVYIIPLILVQSMSSSVVLQSSLQSMQPLKEGVSPQKKSVQFPPKILDWFLQCFIDMDSKIKLHFQIEVTFIQLGSPTEGV